MVKRFTRRVMIVASGCVASEVVFPLWSPAEANPTWLASPRHFDTKLRLGVIADLHGGLAVDAASRLNVFLDSMSRKDCDALVQLGDFAFPNAKHQEYADRLNAAHQRVIHVIGNHEFDFGLKREDCYRAWGINASYYACDLKGIRILVLDGNESGSPVYRGGYPSFIGDEQLAWLEKQLSTCSSPVLILSHQPLAGTSAIDNASKVQGILSSHRSKVALCVNGHSHVDQLVRINGVNYLHHNSASYFWVGGKERMAYYADALFSTLDIDFQKGTVKISARQSRWSDQSPKQLGYFGSGDRPSEAIVVPEIRKRMVACDCLTAD